MNLSDNVTVIKGVGEKVAKLYVKLGIVDIEDLIYHWPRRYDDYSKLQKVKDIKPGPVTLKVQVKSSKGRYARRGLHITEALVSDDSGDIKLTWFNQPYRAAALKTKTWYFVSGEYSYQGDRYSIINPSMELVSDLPKNTARILPIYPETKGLKSHQIRKHMAELLPLIKKLPETLPSIATKAEKLMTHAEAVTQIHFPSSSTKLDAARRRLGFEELYEITLASQLNQQAIASQTGPIIKFDEQLAKQFVAKISFKLTDAQRKSAWQILQDLTGVGQPSVDGVQGADEQRSKSYGKYGERAAKTATRQSATNQIRVTGSAGKQGLVARHVRPMNRLLEGDVGSGKSVVAAMAALMAVKSGYQVAYMAPTEILARQQYEELGRLLSQFGVKSDLLVGSMPTKNKQPVLKALKNGETDLLFGTHALIQAEPIYHNLALVIVDEQHRFGVEQRNALMKKANPPDDARTVLARGSKEERTSRIANTVSERRTSTDKVIRRESAMHPAKPGGKSTSSVVRVPHVLTMTATPIPRTLALTLYGELDISIIDELPPGRLPVITKLVSPSNRPAVYKLIDEQLSQGRQGYVICPLVDDSDVLGVKSVTEEAKRLQQGAFKHRRIGLLHGRLKSEEKDKVMQDFSAGKYDLLVSTTVVEVGVNVPNATVMLIEGAERFGLAQLHQLRGRVRRSSYQSYCYLMPTLVEKPSRRLRAMETTDDGFKLAELDLKLRGPGQIYGLAQSGVLDLRLANLSDVKLIRAAREAAIATVAAGIKLVQYPRLQDRVNGLRKITNLN